ncbi:MAG: hypothetical protein AAGA39_10830, partial [Pseudomonadota bacterium]
MLIVPDGSVKVHIVKRGGKEYVLSKTEFAKLKGDAKKHMMSVYQTLRISCENATGRHDAQLAINDKFPVVSYLSSIGTSSDGPKIQRQVAEAQL